MNLSLIAAIAKNYVEYRGYPIGKDGKLPWNIPEDLKRFRELTLNYPVIMGRKTYESIPEKFRPLKNRLNIIISRNLEYKQEGAHVFHTLEAAVSCLECGFVKQEGIDFSLVYIIGGESVFKKALSIADRLELTHVDQVVEDADAFFPKIGNEWKEVKREDKQGYSFVTYER
ncbi:MAG: dihydrofolate reductase [Nanoarchaeota archaeon]|mgnify:FL=1